jgi:dethiobiotin synthetase
MGDLKTQSQQGLFVTGTDTGVGKTILSAALIAAMVGSGEHVRAYKPVVTGLGEPSGSWPRDHELLASVANMDAEEVSALRFDPPVSPHLAASLAGRPVDPTAILELARNTGKQATLIVEGVGGLLVPLTEDYTVCDLAKELGLPVLIAARPGLGTINHSLLTLNAARAAGLEVCAVVLTPWPSKPSALEHSNRQTIARMGAVEVEGLPYVQSPDPDALGDAAASLPWRRWLGQPSIS